MMTRLFAFLISLLAADVFWGNNGQPSPENFDANAGAEFISRAEVLPPEPTFKLAEKERPALEREPTAAPSQKWMAELLALLAAGLGLSMFFRQHNQCRLLEKENQALKAHEALNWRALENARLQLETVNTELEQATKLLGLKNEFIDQLEMSVGATAPRDHVEPPAASELAQLRQMRIFTTAQWEEFRGRFEAVFPRMMHRLHKQFPALTEAEMRLFLLLKIGLLNHQIADALGISLESVWKSRYRLKKKMALADESQLDYLVRTFE